MNLSHFIGRTTTSRQVFWNSEHMRHINSVLSRVQTSILFNSGQDAELKGCKLAEVNTEEVYKGCAKLPPRSGFSAYL